MKKITTLATIALMVLASFQTARATCCSFSPQIAQDGCCFVITDYGGYCPYGLEYMWAYFTSPTQTNPVETTDWTTNYPTMCPTGAGYFALCVRTSSSCYIYESNRIYFDPNTCCTVMASAGADQSTCPGGSVNLSAGASGGNGYNFAWSNGLGNGQNKSVSPTSTTTYTVTVTDSNGCSDTDQVTVTVHGTPNANAGANQSICPGGSTTLTASGGGSYAWSNGLGSGATKTVSPTSTTTYTVTVTNGNGCTDTDQVTVTVNGTPNANAGANQSICPGSSTTLTASGGGTYAWSNGLGSGATKTVSPTSTTTYTVTVTNGNGCTDTDQVTVTVNGTPNANAGANQSICPGGSTTLTASGGGTYTWSNGLGSGATKTVSPTSTTTYTVTVTNGNGCTATDQVTVTVNGTPNANAGANQTICAGESATLTASGGGTYTWSNGLGSGASKTVSPTSTTTYTVTVTNGENCTDTDQVTVTVSNGPSADAGANQSVCIGESVSLSATASSGTAPYTYNWTASAGSLSNGSTANPTFTMMTLGTYTLTVEITDNNGCTATDQVEVTISDCKVSIGSTVFVDFDDSGTQDAGDTGISGVLVQVYSAGPNGTFEMGMGDDVLVGSDVTDENGDYYVGNLDPGQYQVVIPVMNFGTGNALEDYNTSSTGNGSDNQTDIDDNGIQDNIGEKTYSDIITLTIGGEPENESGQGGGQDVAAGLPDANGDMTIDFGFVPNDFFQGCELVIEAQTEYFICPGEDVSLTAFANGPSIFEWSTGASSTSITVNPISTTTYTLTVTGLDCDGQETISFTVITDQNLCSSSVNVAANAILGGAGQVSRAKSNGTLMHDKLRAAGLIPLTDPYGTNQSTNFYALRDRAELSVVDWVCVELRDENDPSLVIAEQAGLLLRDGRVVDPTDGQSDMTIDGVPHGNYYVAVKHRNHGAVMSRNAVYLSDTAHPCDFTNPNTPTWGDGACYLEDGYMMMFGGNGNGDGWIRGTGPSSINDLTQVLFRLGQYTNVISSTYSNYDINMDGTVRGTGPSSINDLTQILFTLGQYTNVIHQQTP